jgi:phosphoribosylaminoimidazolecarboxamide formyltransferase/IMP cyclohydrolase
MTINLQVINRCLISVSNKTNIVKLAKFLEKNQVEIISTGGTYKLLKENNIKVLEVSSWTNFPEIMDGRVKTLNPKIHGGLLAIADNPEHQLQAKTHQIEAIDLLIVNLYPFVETVEKTNDEDEIIENIDIGGPAMIRSACKNFYSKTVISEVEDYDLLIDHLNDNNSLSKQFATSLEFRRSMASKAFNNIANYDIAIAKWIGGDHYFLNGKLKQKLRYGENSHQSANVFVNNKHGIVNAIQLQGKELSYNNFNDADCAYNLVLEFDQPACVIVKHANPCGVAISENINLAFDKAFNADSKSAFGGIVAINREVDQKLALLISGIFFEVVIAPKFSSEAIEILSSKKNLRLLEADFKKQNNQQVKTISGGFLVQEYDYKTFNIEDLKQVSIKAISNQEIMQLIFAMTVCKHLKSNAIVVANNFQTIGLGIGQTNRVDACEIACLKANKLVNEIKRTSDYQVDNNQKSDDFLYLASDAFFPFADNIEIAGKYNVRAIVAPSGSIRDQEVIDKANELKIALYFISSRHFKH